MPLVNLLYSSIKTQHKCIKPLECVGNLSSLSTLGGIYPPFNNDVTNTAKTYVSDTQCLLRTGSSKPFRSFTQKYIVHMCEMS